MNRLYRNVAGVALLAVVCHTTALAATLPTGFAEVQVASGLSNPTAMAFAPDGRLFVCLQGGQVRVIQNGTLLSTPFLSVTVDSGGERGLLGLAFDPNFATNQFVYIYYTATTPVTHNRVSRFVANGNVAVPGSETFILDLDNLSSATNHNGGALHFGLDGKLYIAVGENANGANSQSMNNLLGKILRINADGTIPTDNPFIPQTTGKNQAIWAIGLRNPYTFAFEPFSGRMLINDVGQNTYEEINDGFAGSNYGWPTAEGPSSNPSFRNPIYYYPHSGGPVTGCAITGGSFYSPPNTQFPGSFVGTYFFADFCGGWIKVLDPANNNAVSSFASGIASPVDLQVGPNGNLYYLARGVGAVVRVFFTSDEAPQITQQPANRTVGVGQSATFTVGASGFPAPSYQWQRNGVDMQGATSISYTITSATAGDNGARFRAIATNIAGSATSAEAVLTVVASRPNVALASNGATAVASSTYANGFSPSGAINGDRKGQSWGNGGGWTDATPGAWPDWLEVDFAGVKTIEEVDVFGVQDNYATPVEPTPGMTFTRYGVRAFAVQFWDGTQWLDVPGGDVDGNTLVWYQLTFAPVTTTKIRILVTGTPDSWSRLTEVEAYQAAGPVDTPPTVVLTAPAEGTTYTAPASITLTANAADADGTVKRVDFYENGTLVGSDATSPYAFTWLTNAAGPHTLTAVATDNLDVTTTSAPVHITVNAAAGRTNVALASNGSTAIASSTYASGFAASGAINGDRKGQAWGNGGGWNDATPGTWPDWLEVDFAGVKTIDEVDVFSVQDNYAAPVEPTAGLTFTRYGLVNFTVQYWDGTQWLAVPGGSVSGNSLVWRTVTFAPLMTMKIRILVTGTSDSWSRLTEVEAYQAAGPVDTPPTVMLTAPTEGTTFTAPASITVTADAADSDGTVQRVDVYDNGNLVGSDTTSPYSVTWATSVAGPHTLTAVATDNLSVATTSAPVHITVNAAAGRTNVALAANGAIAVASSIYSTGFDASAAINGDRKGQSWGNGGGWTDATPGTWPDWLEVDFAGPKTIEEVDVFSVQDNYAAPVEPTAGMTFTQYGLVNFTVQYWDGTQWLAVPGGIVSGNSLVWCQLTFAPLTTTKIRVLIAGTGDSWSRVTEVEAYSQPNSPSPYSAYTGTDPKPLPPTPVLGPANTAIADPTFGSRILRVTDENTQSGQSFISIDAGFFRAWNADSTAIKLTGPHGDGYWLEFDPSTFKVGDGSSHPAVHSLPFGARWEWSTIDPHIIYYLNGSQIARYNKVIGVSTNLAGPSTGDPVGYMAVVVGRDHWVCAAAGPGIQDTWTKIFCVNPTSPSITRLIDTVNKTIDGVPQGDPNWPTSAPNQVLGIHNISGGTGASWLEVTFHQQSWGANGGAVFNLSTNTWTRITNADVYWSGHVSMGNGKYANSSGSINGLDSRGMVLRNPDDAMNSGEYRFIAQPSSPWNGWCDADHSSWLNSVTNPNAPILISRYGGSSCYQYAWAGEIDAAAVDGSNTVWRFAHTHNSGNSCYYGLAFAQISNDGRWALFSSPWDGTLGSDTAFGCSNRIDTFIVDLTGSSAW